MSRRRAWFDKYRGRLFDLLPPNCANCGSGEYLEVHHIVPVGLGGTNNLGNLVKLCAECHGKAHGMSGRSSLRQAQAQGIEKAKAEGKYQGRPQDKAKREDIRQALMRGLSVRKTAEFVGCSTSTVQAVKQDYLVSNGAYQ